MGTATKFLILYLIPVISFAGTVGTYIFVYGESVDHPLIDIALALVVLGFLFSSIVSVKLISQFLSNNINYLGVFFAVVGWLLELVPVSVYMLLLVQ
ncbi:hypothetical protein [Vreelandella venusta]|uniref:hypothetical protein n=1 Tax=Vreelandella venusta TaxID=44935 RepID=UPI00200C2698|nr:hypothetical protein [Halomonas venusta]UQI39000.1 hypothetical protein M3L73_12220 [Halomonas venusta]